MAEDAPGGRLPHEPPEESADRAVARAMTIFRDAVLEGGLQLRRIVAVEAIAIDEEREEGSPPADRAPAPAA